MTPIALACTWQPRGEFPRLARLTPALMQRYVSITILLPPETEQALVETLVEDLGIRAVIAHDWTHARHDSLRHALKDNVNHVHYIDLDRLLYWAEVAPEELRQTLNVITVTDCLVMGRTENAWQTHPQAMRMTEATFNESFSYFLGQPMDIGASSRGFSRRVAQFILQHSSPGRAIGVESEWLVLIQRAGFSIDYLAVDGLGWETPDHYHEDMVVDINARLQMAAEMDMKWDFWLRRAHIARQIVEAGVNAMRQPLYPN